MTSLPNSLEMFELLGRRMFNLCGNFKQPPTSPPSLRVALDGSHHLCTRIAFPARLRGFSPRHTTDTTRACRVAGIWEGGFV